ncbi:MAG: sugar ABC transporter permease [Candidatus Sumerlaeia bacterium]|nr:sugar ABC transporter permease [Candidatus Sumerlaeia bacterium]
MTNRERAHLRAGLLFVAPWLTGLALLIALPTAMTVYYSFCDYSVLKEPVFIGLANYKDLAKDPVFLKSLWNTGFFAFFALPLGTLFAIFLAILLNQDIPARPVFRTIFFLPSLVPLVALAILWQWMFNGRFGVINHGLSKLGVDGPNWLGDTTWAKPALIAMGLWGVGHAVVIYLAGLQDIPKSLYEAARVDGADWWQQTRHVTLPMLSPVIYFNLLMGCIGVLQVFAVPYIMTGGGPARSTLFLTMYLYDQAFVYLNMGYACAMALVLFALIAGLTFAAHKLAGRHVVYGGN